MGNVIDSIPVIGHIKGGVHYAMGENEQCIVSIKSATRTTVVAIGGITGYAATGEGYGAVAGGMIGGLAADVGITEVDKAFNPNPTPYGYVATWQSGELRDIAMVPLTMMMDGLIGCLAATGSACLTITVNEKGTRTRIEFSLFSAAGDRPQTPRFHFDKKSIR